MVTVSGHPKRLRHTSPISKSADDASGSNESLIKATGEVAAASLTAPGGTVIAGANAAAAERSACRTTTGTATATVGVGVAVAEGEEAPAAEGADVVVDNSPANASAAAKLVTGRASAEPQRPWQATTAGLAH